LVAGLGCGTWFFLIEEQLYCVMRFLSRYLSAMADAVIEA